VGSRAGLNSFEKGKISYPYRKSKHVFSTDQAVVWSLYCVWKRNGEVEFKLRRF